MRFRLGLVLSLCTLVACADDSLGDKFQKTDSDVSTEPESPLQVGYATRYLHIASYKPSATQIRGNDLQDESQRSGNVCIKIDQVKDTAKQAYANAEQTLVKARLRAKGSSEQNDLYTSVNTIAGEAVNVDARLAALWLRNLTFPSSAHGYGTAKAEDFTTQAAPTPTGTIKNLLFFDTRTFSDESWMGWDGATLTSAPNFSNKLFVYFGAKGSDFFSGNDFDSRLVKATNCTDSLACYTAVFVWRETSALFADRLALLPNDNAFADASSSVLHSLHLEYDTLGILKRAEEYIIPDLHPASAVPGGITACLDSEPCLFAVMDNFEDFAETSCAF